jgi:hypothetical protein
MLTVAVARVFRTIRDRRRFKARRLLLVAGVLYIVEYLVRMTLLDLQIRFGPQRSLRRHERLTIIVPVYGRLENLRPIVRSALCLPFLDRIVVVNANPQARVADWLPRDDDRVIGIDDPDSGVGVRFSVALDYPSEYYFTIDDDVILRPDQLTRLFDILVEQPEVTHGILGERYVGAAGDAFEHGLRGKEVEVDLLNSFHAFTHAHLDQYHRNLEMLGLPASREIHNGEDIVMALSGTGRPRVHAIGRWIMCPSTMDAAVALHFRRPGFRAERAELFLRVNQAVGREV